jgi:2-oxoglutarate ferredoxin oxidoreductase subunit gamma
MTTRQIRFSCAGGQGGISAALAVVKSALESGCFDASFKGTYSSRVIGGPTLGDVLINMDKKINYPCTIMGEVEFMISTANNSFQQYKDGIKIGGLAVIDPNLVYPNENDRKIIRFIEIPIIQIAVNEVGNKKTQSAIALAVAVKIIALMMEINIDEETAFNALIETVRKPSQKVIDANKKAFTLGLKYAEEGYNELLEFEATIAVLFLLAYLFYNLE